MFWKKKEETPSIPWQALTSLEQLEEIKKESLEQPVVIYKHSTTCGISGMVMNRLERNWKESLAHVKIYYLDLLTYRSISHAIADTFQVYHESPQILIVKDGHAIYDASHMGISVDGIAACVEDE